MLRKLIILPIKFYKYFISPLLGCHCRYMPGCADYAKEAIHKHGVVKGGFMAFYRILRCNPLGGHGYDPVK